MSNFIIYFKLNEELVTKIDLFRNYNYLNGIIREKFIKTPVELCITFPDRSKFSFIPGESLKVTRINDEFYLIQYGIELMKFVQNDKKSPYIFEHITLST